MFSMYGGFSSDSGLEMLSLPSLMDETVFSGRSFFDESDLSSESGISGCPSCPIHHLANVFICKTCSGEHLCVFCVRLHKDHDISALSRDSENVLQTLVSGAAQAQKTLEESKQQVARMYGRVEAATQTAIWELRSWIHYYLSGIEKRNRELKEHIDVIHRERIKNLQDQSLKMDVQIRDFQEAVKAAASCLSGKKQSTSSSDEDQNANAKHSRACSEKLIELFYNFPAENELLPCETDQLKFQPPDSSVYESVRALGELRASASPNQSCVVGEALHQAVADRANFFLVKIKDACGSSYHDSSKPEISLVGPYNNYMHVTTEEIEPGLLKVTYVPLTEGRYNLDVTIRGKSIGGCPCAISVRRGRSYSDIMARGPIFSFGKEGEGDGEFCRPWGICCDSSSRIIVADRSNNRIQIFDKFGQFITKFGSSGSKDGQFDRPAGVCTNSKREIIVADKDNHRVQVFDETGNFLLKFGERGRGPGSFNYPWGVSCSTSDSIAVADTRNHRVQIFNSEGVFLRKCGYDNSYFYKHIDSPRGVCFLPNGEFVISDFNNHRLVRLSADGASSGMKIYGGEGQDLGLFCRPQGIAVDSEGHLLICDSRNNRIQVLEPGTLKAITGFGGYREQPTDQALPSTIEGGTTPGHVVALRSRLTDMKEDDTVYEAFVLYATSEIEDDRRSAIGLAVQAIRSLVDSGDLDKIEELFRLLYSFGNDTELVTKSLFEQISPIYAECQDSSTLYSQLDVFLTPMLIQSIESVSFVELLTKICRQPGLISKQFLFKSFISPFSQLLTDPDLQVRKHCYGALGVFAELFGEFFTERCVVPHLIVGLHDNEWVIRKACCEIFVDVARNVSMKIRRSFLAPRFQRLLDDHSSWVSRAASERLGSFIFTFAGGNCRTQSDFSGSDDSGSIKSSHSQQKRENKDLTSCSSESSCSSSSVCSSEEDQDRYANIPEEFHWPSSREVDNYYREWFGTAVPLGKDDQFSGSDDFEQRLCDNENLKVVKSTLELKDIPISTDLSTFKIAVNEEEDYAYDDGEFETDREAEKPVDIPRCESPIMGESANEPSPIDPSHTVEVDEMEKEDETYDDSTYWGAKNPFGISDEDLMSYDVNVSTSKAIPNAAAGDIALQREIGEEEAAAEHDQSDDSLPVFNDSDESLDEGGDMNTTFVSFHHDSENYSSNFDKSGALGTSHNESYGSMSSESHKELDEEGRRRMLLERIDHFRELLTEADVDFILNTDQAVIPQELLDSFLSVHKIGSYSDIYVEAALHFAQNLPAVAFTLGRDNWPLLKGTFLYLCRDSRIEPALASILHELAAILGPDVSDLDLVPVFNEMIKSGEEVKSLLVMHLYDFLRHLSAPVRTRILVEINCFLSSQQERNWRFRYEFIAQCAKLCDLFSLDLLNKYLCGIALTLCTDQVASVRDVALDLIIEILARFVQSEWKVMDINDKRDRSDMPLSNVLCEDLLRGFGNSQSWRRRQTFAMCCEKILKTNVMSDEQFSFFFGDVFLKLAGDHVANIRLKFCEALDRGRGAVDAHDKDKENAWFTDERRSAEFLDRVKTIRSENEEASVRIAACRALGISEDNELSAKGPNLRELEMNQFEHLRRSSGELCNGNVQTTVMIIGDGSRSQ
ncbi:hypothetical protein QR680_009132 [Steinernema hermaphroditum]|uniref:Phosphatase 2A Regulatory Subunit A helical domain-containing protein n=1 Tax=Steinernema hermaphroditum TaxID=289476 RepID=A0AA39M9B9_9BILA|nr:hypothetical protein QR680_009132 [Steinernema hermaphroditum]